MVEVAAVHGSANASLIAGYGYSGILVAFIARQNPLAVVPVAILVGGIAASGGLLQRRLGLPDASVIVLLGLAFVLILASETLHGRVKSSERRASRRAARVKGEPRTTGLGPRRPRRAQPQRCPPSGRCQNRRPERYTRLVGRAAGHPGRAPSASARRCCG